MELPTVRVGFGTLPLAGPTGLGTPPSEEEAAGVLRAAVQAGVRVIDTAWYYGPDTINELVARTLKPYPEDLIVVSKLGNSRDREGNYIPQVNPTQLREACHRTLHTLHTDFVPLLLLRWRSDLDLSADFELAWQCLLQMQQGGKAQFVGLSNVSLTHIARAQQLGVVSAVSNAYSVSDQSDDHILRYCEVEDIWFIPYYPLQRGKVLMSRPCISLANKLNVSPTQVALAWLLKRSPRIVPIPGSCNRDHVLENLGALNIDLTPRELIELAGVELHGGL